jgi:hypothetical protein
MKNGSVLGNTGQKQLGDCPAGDGNGHQLRCHLLRVSVCCNLHQEWVQAVILALSNGQESGWI